MLKRLMKSSLVSKQLGSCRKGVTPKGEVRNGLLVGCQRVFTMEGCRDCSVVSVGGRRGAEQGVESRKKKTTSGTPLCLRGVEVPLLDGIGDDSSTT